MFGSYLFQYKWKPNDPTYIYIKMVLEIISGLKNIGMLDNNFSNTINNIKQPFSITYIYLDEQSIYEYYFEPAKGITKDDAIGRIASESSTGTWTTLSKLLVRDSYKTESFPNTFLK